MKNSDAITLVTNCHIGDGVYCISQETGVYLIQQYVKDKKKH